MTLTDHDDFWNVVAACAAAIAVAFCFWNSQANKLSYSIHDPNPAYRAAALRAISSGDDETAILEALGDDNQYVRLIALEKLGARSRKPVLVAQVIIPLLKDKHAGIRQQAAWSLREIGDGAWPAIKEVLLDEDPGVRLAAVRAIRAAENTKDGLCWPMRELEEAAPILEKLKSDENAEVREYASRALQSISRKPH